MPVILQTDNALYAELIGRYARCAQACSATPDASRTRRVAWGVMRYGFV